MRCLNHVALNVVISFCFFCHIITDSLIRNWVIGLSSFVGSFRRFQRLGPIFSGVLHYLVYNKMKQEQYFTNCCFSHCGSILCETIVFVYSCYDSVDYLRSTWGHNQSPKALRPKIVRLPIKLPILYISCSPIKRSLLKSADFLWL